MLLITSRETRRWVIPKGNRMKGLSDSEAAAVEAHEEAGVHGEIAREAFGVYGYAKRLRRDRMRPCEVAVFPLEVLIQQGDWAERDERERRWMTAKAAAAAVGEPDLAGLIRAFATRLQARGQA